MFFLGGGRPDICAHSGLTASQHSRQRQDLRNTIAFKYRSIPGLSPTDHSDVHVTRIIIHGSICNDVLE